MGFMLLIQKIGLLFLLISASLLFTSFAGRPSTLMNKLVKDTGALHEAQTMEKLRHVEVSDIHERLLTVNTKDYGRYDPSPALSKPPFKLIPN